MVITKTLLILLFLVNSAYAGMDFTYMRGKGREVRENTVKYLAALKDKNKKTADEIWVRIQEILRNMPDKDRRSKLMAEYLALLEKIRRTARDNAMAFETEEGNSLLVALKTMVLRQGAAIETSSKVIRRKTCLEPTQRRTK